MMRFLFDEDFDNDILAALRQRLPFAILTRNQDVGLRTLPDTTVLEWAAANGYVLISHDRRTLFDHFAERMTAGKSSPGIVIVKRNIPIKLAIESLELLIGAGLEDDLNDNIVLIP